MPIPIGSIAPNQNGNNKPKRKHGETIPGKSAINQDVQNFAFNYERMSNFEECAVCGIEDECSNKVSDIAEESYLLIKDAFDALVERSDNNLFLADLNTLMEDGFLKDRDKVCR